MRNSSKVAVIQPEIAVDSPIGLSPKSEAIWRQIVPKRGRSIGRLILIEQGLKSLDRANEAAEVLKLEGLTSKTETTGAIHIHPLVKVERESRALFAKIWDQLGLGWDGSIDGRIDL